MKKRNYLIDILRGITALNIVLIHTVWWSGQGYIPDWVRNISLLLDVPMFFFLAGWSSAYSKANNVFKNLVDNQKKWLFFLVLYAIFVELIKPPGYSVMQMIQAFLYIFPDYSLWIYPTLYGSLWFMPVFISVSILFFPFRALLEKLESKDRMKLGYSIILVILLGFFYAAFGRNFFYIPLTVLFYAFFYALGNLTRNLRIKGLGQLVIYLFVIAVIEWVMFKYFSMNIFDLQTWKFGPSVPYMVPSMIGILLVLYIKDRWVPNRLPILSWAGENAIWLYFSQGIASSLLYEFLMFIPLIHWSVRFMIALLFNLSLSLLLAFLLSKGYQWGNAYISKLLVWFKFNEIEDI